MFTVRSKTVSGCVHNWTSVVGLCSQFDIGLCLQTDVGFEFTGKIYRNAKEFFHLTYLKHTLLEALFQAFLSHRLTV